MIHPREPRAPGLPRTARWMISSLALLLLTDCAPRYTLVSHRDAAKVAEKNETFGFRKWVAKDTDPDVVIIGIHGFDGASIDYENLGKSLLKNQPGTALYAYEVRGQGSDPLKPRRGDIDDPQRWYVDLDTFTGLVRKRHPGARVVWMGESMGALIASHAWRIAPPGKPPCDGLILSSPVVKIRDDVPPWKVGLLNLAAVTAPTARVSLEALSGGEDVQMTHTSTHTEQAETNAWHVDKHTLRLLSALGRHIGSMDECAETFRVPVLILHGGRDFFTTDDAVREFSSHIPSGVPVTTRIYPDSYHLLMYDTRKDDVIRDIERWTGRFRDRRL